MTEEQPRAAGAVVFRRTPRGALVLVVRAFEVWDFPKGMVRPGETAFDAAGREVRETTGLGEIDFPFDDAHRDTLPHAAGIASRYHLAETDEEILELPPSPGGAAQHEFRWVNFDEAEDLLPPRLAVVLDWAKRTITGN